MAFHPISSPRRMQHRRFAFVGDSLGQQMFLSLLCMLAPKGPPASMKKKKSPIRDVGRSDYGFYLPKGARRPTGWAFKFAASNTTIIFKWNSFLAEQQPAAEMDGEAKKGALHIDRPEEFVRKHLRELDVLVMNTGHHWNRWVRGNGLAMRWVPPRTSSSCWCWNHGSTMMVLSNKDELFLSPTFRTTDTGGYWRLTLQL